MILTEIDSFSFFFYKQQIKDIELLFIQKEKSMKEILGSLFNAITSYLHWIQCTVKYETFERKVKVDKYTTKFGNFINLFVDHKDIIGTMNF